MEHLHVETQPGDPMGSSVTGGQALWDLSASEMEATPGPVFPCPILHIKLPLSQTTTGWREAMRDNCVVSPCTWGPGVAP